MVLCDKRKSACGEKRTWRRNLTLPHYFFIQTEWITYKLKFLIWIYSHNEIYFNRSAFQKLNLNYMYYLSEIAKQQKYYNIIILHYSMIHTILFL